jgi:multidrug resistance efflux pump
MQQVNTQNNAKPSWRGRLGRWAWRTVPLIVLACGALGFAALYSTRPQLAQQAVAEKVWPVRAAPARLTTVKPTLSFYGEVIAGREVELRPLVGGRVERVGPNFQDGGQVSTGEALIEIEAFDYEAAVAEATADLAEARARLRELQTDVASGKAMLEQEQTARSLRQRDVDRYVRLQRQGAASVRAYDDAQMALLGASERVIEREFTIERLNAILARQAAVIERLEVKAKRAARDLHETKLVAPFAGYLTDIGTQVGKRIGQNDKVARLIDSSSLEVRFSLGMQYFGELTATGTLVGLSIDVIWNLQGQARRFTAVVERTGSEIDASSGGVAVFARITGGQALGLLRPGAFVEVEVPGLTYHNVVRLPETAWHNGKVLLVRDGRLVPHAAQLARRIGTDVLLRGNFSAEDVVLVTPIPGAAEGMRVDIVTQDGAGG